MVSGDPSQLDRLLINLLSNAVKFTPRGGRIEVTVGGGHGTAVITVTDTGIGIPEAERHLVSTRFFRAANAVKRAIPGTGLGLAIAGTIVANHGGELTIDSAEGQGTTVTVRIPQLPVIPAASHRRQTMASQRTSTQAAAGIRPGCLKSRQPGPGRRIKHFQRLPRSRVAPTGTRPMRASL